LALWDDFRFIIRERSYGSSRSTGRWGRYGKETVFGKDTRAR
jgi:hypothetical protein